jgi:SAM-dependent methyltransferase
MSADGSRSREIARQYDAYQATFDSLDKQQQFLNFGYTVTHREKYEARQAALCAEVFRAARIGEHDVIIDVGFGSGEQDFLLCRTHRFGHLSGFNVSDLQVQYAKHRALHEGLADKLSFHQGEAERLLGVAAGGTDLILAIECAFYFDRQRFYRRAAAVLKPGGRVVLADIMLSDRLGSLLQRRPGGGFGTATSNRAAWEKHLQTHLIRRINAQTWPGAQITVFKILATLLRSKLSRPERRAWSRLAMDCQLIALGLATRLLRYDLLVLKKAEAHHPDG